MKHLLAILMAVLVIGCAQKKQQVTTAQAKPRYSKVYEGNRVITYSKAIPEQDTVPLQVGQNLASVSDDVVPNFKVTTPGTERSWTTDTEIAHADLERDPRLDQDPDDEARKEKKRKRLKWGLPLFVVGGGVFGLALALAAASAETTLVIALAFTIGGISMIVGLILIILALVNGRKLLKFKNLDIPEESPEGSRHNLGKIALAFFLIGLVTAIIGIGLLFIAAALVLAIIALFRRSSKSDLRKAWLVIILTALVTVGLILLIPMLAISG